MASRIEPDPKAKPSAPAAKPVPKQSATPQAKPATPAAKPAATKPAGPPPAAGKPGVTAAQQPAGEADAQDAEDDGGRNAVAAGLLKQTPAWAVSMLVHIVALLAMALMVTPPPEKEKIRVITSSAPEVNEDFEEFEQEEPLENTEQTEVAEMAVPTTDVAVVEDVQVVSQADDLDAAPLAVEMADFSSETAPAADMMSTIGAVGGTGGGFGGRANAAAMAAKEGGGGDTEAAVDRALKWFVEHQLDDGSWSFDLAACPRCQGKCSHSGKYKDNAGATAMALLPFLGRGYTHREGPYKKSVERGIAFLAASAVANKGKVYGKGGSMYSQGLAGIALSECYGMTQDNRLAMPTQLALNFIMTSQDQRGGGWRYSPGQAGDTSAVGWQIMALKSGNMAYLQVNPMTIKKAVDFLNFVQADSGATYGYTDNSSPAPGRSAVGLLCRMYLGWKKDNPALQDGVARLAKIGPSKDLYHSYYATQIMHHMEGDVWIAWNTKMKSMLLKTQSSKDHEAGSWYEGVEGGHGAHAAGRLYCTALATMILEVYYRHLPIYRNQSVDEEFKE